MAFARQSLVHPRAAFQPKSNTGQRCTISTSLIVNAFSVEVGTTEDIAEEDHARAREKGTTRYEYAGESLVVPSSTSQGVRTSGQTSYVREART